VFRMKAKSLAHKQQGAATLLTALVLLISITLVALFTSKTVLIETQIAADNYRTGQAAAAANAAMDHAVAYFNAGGLDQNADGSVDFTGPGAEPTEASCVMPATTASPLTLTSGTQTTLAQFYFNNASGNACDCTGPSCMSAINMNRALVTARGWSDDCTAVRTITQCLTTYDVFDSGQSPQQPFVSKAGVGAFGNAKIINRYTNSSIWSGGADTVSGASFGTYLRPSGKEIADYTQAQLDSPDEDANTQKVSDRNSGRGIDVIINDPTLGNKTTSTTNYTNPADNQFFDMFFAHTKSDIRNNSQLLASGASLAGKTGLVWVNGNAAINGGTIGTAAKPIILIVDGTLRLTGNPTIYGVVYVTGELDIAGTPVVMGSMVSENGPNTGTGTLTLVYKPWGGDGTESPPFVDGTGAIVAGSWKDW